MSQITPTSLDSERKWIREENKGIPARSLNKEIKDATKSAKKIIDKFLPTKDEKAIVVVSVLLIIGNHKFVESVDGGSADLGKNLIALAAYVKEVGFANVDWDIILKTFNVVGRMNALGILGSTAGLHSIIKGILNNYKSLDKGKTMKAQDSLH